MRRGSPRGIAFLGEEGETSRWTFGDLAEVAQRAAGALRNLGISPGDRVGLLGSTTPELVAAVFGCWASGVIAVPLAVPLRLTAPEALVEEIGSRAQKADVSLLACDPRVRAFVPLEGIAPRIVDLPELLGDGRAVPFETPAPDDPALIQFTSGSTAQPKGVVLTHRALMTNCFASAEHVSLSRSDVAVSWLPLYHDFGLIGLTLWPLIIDFPTHLIPPETFIASPKRWLVAMSRHRATVTAAPNFASRTERSARSACAPTMSWRATGRTRKLRREPCATAGSAPETSASSARTVCTSPDARRT
jgi:acyl-CoA synthetase (AMP-forming)/AMP-acid ligase II